MGTVTAVFDAIAAVPKILGYVETFALFIQGQVDAAKKRKASADEASAAAIAQKTKDTSGLDASFDPDKKTS
jgi:hypothetical protein